MVTQGTRGDFQPYVALCLQLRDAGYHVRCYAYENHTNQAKQYALEFFPVRRKVDLNQRATAQLLRAAGDLSLPYI